MLSAAAMIDQDDARFSSFTRDLARRHRRPRSYPPPPARADVLEQLCAGGSIIPTSAASFPSFPSGPSLASLASFLGGSDDSGVEGAPEAPVDLEDEPS